MQRTIPLYKIILLALPFCFGLYLIAGSYHPYTDRWSVEGAYFDPIPFAAGVLTCVISGLPLIKAARAYLKSPTREAEHGDEQGRKKGE
jgi:hypothetical protein